MTVSSRVPEVPATSSPSTPPSAPAALRAQELELVWTRAHSLHYGGRSGASHENSRGRVTVELDARGGVFAIDAGRREESVLSGGRYARSVTEWSFSWRGTWLVIEGAPRIELERENAACTVTETDGRGVQNPPTVTTCPLASEKLELECEAGSVDAVPSVEEPTVAPSPVPVWSCAPTPRRATTSGTPFAWVFGKERCLEQAASGRGASVRYAFCTP